jgi:hypothetical protein
VRDGGRDWLLLPVIKDIQELGIRFYQLHMVRIKARQISMKITIPHIMFLSFALVTSGCVTNQPSNTSLTAGPSNGVLTEAPANTAPAAKESLTKEAKVKKKKQEY